MKTKGINEYLKGSTIRDQAAETLLTEGWYRIATAESIFDATMLLNMGKNMMISLTRVYSNTPNEAYLISLTGSYNSPFFKVINSSTEGKLFNKIRYVKSDDNKIYIEVYYMKSVRNSAMVGIYGQSKYNDNDIVFTTLPFLPAGDTATVIAEQDI